MSSVKRGCGHGEGVVWGVSVWRLCVVREEVWSGEEQGGCGWGTGGKGGMTSQWGAVWPDKRV